MNVVLYTYDLEPITVVDLPQRWIDVGVQRGTVVVAVMPPMAVPPYKAADDIVDVRLQTVTINFEPLYFRGVRSCILLTHDDVEALLLKPGWLPGQRGEINQMRAEIRGFAEILIRALDRPH